MVLNHLSDDIVTASQIKSWSEKYPILARVHHLVQGECSISDPGLDLCPYFQDHTELNITDGCILSLLRVVIPVEGRRNIIKQLHEMYPGVSKMKSLAHHMFGVQQCKICQLHRSMPSETPLHLWEFLSRPWVRVHIDHIGPF